MHVEEFLLRSGSSICIRLQPRKWRPQSFEWNKATFQIQKGSGSEFSNTGSISVQVTESNFGKDGDEVIILLGGGTKKKQKRDIGLAAERWRDYKRRKKLGEV